MPLVSYLLRNAADAEETYGEGFAEEAEAVGRARQLADPYPAPVDVVTMIAGHIHVGATRRVEPGPTAPLDE
jgi:hypothetical protein